MKMNAPKLDGDSMAERDYSKEYAREKEQQKKVFAKITPKQYEDFTKATEKNCTTKNAVLKQFIIDYIDKNLFFTPP